MSLASEKPIWEEKQLDYGNVALANSVPAQKKQSWIRQRWPAVVAVILVPIVVLAALGLVYTQPWSRIKVIADIELWMGDETEIVVFIDGVEKANTWVYKSEGATVIGTWSVVPGSHMVSIDVGKYRFDEFLREWVYSGPDGQFNHERAYKVGPLSTVEVVYGQLVEVD